MKTKVLVRDIMSKVVISMKETDRPGMAHLEMHVEAIRHLPVVDADDHVVGVVSSRDLARVIERQGAAPRTLGEVMTRFATTVHRSSEAHEAASLMLENKIGCVPVVDDDQRLVGIVTETDFVSIARDCLLGRGLPLSGRG
jgi:CBS domain-containing protein